MRHQLCLHAIISLHFIGRCLFYWCCVFVCNRHFYFYLQWDFNLTPPHMPDTFASWKVADVLTGRERRLFCLFDWTFPCNPPIPSIQILAVWSVQVSVIISIQIFDVAERSGHQERLIWYDHCSAELQMAKRKQIQIQIQKLQTQIQKTKQ